jgi:transposase InsO family protein
MEEILEMSNKELECYHILSQINNGHISQLKGAELLGLSARQVRNLLHRLNIDGPKGLISKKRGHPSNRSYDPKFKQRVLEIIRQHYEDFGPTLISEKLKENHQVTVSDETIRSWMMQTNMWTVKQRKRNKHRLRQRKECFGELIQIDGSHHDWFEGRGDACVLIVFIDDATSKITSLYFSDGETLDAYFNALERHLKRYGKPRAIYSDRFAIFQSQKDQSLTQFRRALKTLSVSHFTAGSPQAKGRVERANQTLQDRLIKEMRLKNISSIEEANQFCEEYMEMHNSKFSKEPISLFDAHRPLEMDLSRILCRYEERTLTNGLSICFYNKTYQICERHSNLPKNAKIEVRQQRDGKLRLFFKDQELAYVLYDELPYEEVTKMQEWRTRKNHSPHSSHPWKNRPFNRRIKQKQIRHVI